MHFENYMATKLPVGTEIYTTVEEKEFILIAIVGNKQLPYLGLVEG